MIRPRLFAPSIGERQLLHAAFRSDSDAAIAWRRWCASNDLERLEQSEYRLLPLVARRRAVVTADDPELGRLRGIHRRVWLDSTLRLRAAAPLLHALARRGIRAVLLKGAALGTHAYEDLGSRPMADVDALVSEDRFADAVAAARELGFVPLAPGDPVRRLRAVNAVALARTDDPHAHIDLHARPFDLLVPRSCERELIARARPITVADAPAFVPDPADHLLIIANHGLRPSTVGPVRWASDAATLVRRHGASIDWPRLLADAGRFRLAWTLLQVLRFVRDELEAPVPDEVLSRLESTPLSWTERLERPRRLRTHTVGADAASLLSPWFRLGVRGRDSLRFAPRVATLTPVRAAWFAWKHLVLRPREALRNSRRNNDARTVAHPMSKADPDPAPPSAPIAASGAHAHPHAK